VAVSEREISRELQIAVPEAGTVSGLLLRPEGARWVVCLAHGAGAGMRHGFLEALAAKLAAVKMATLRYQFPYMEARRARPDPPNIATRTVVAAAQTAAAVAPGLAVLAGGKSFGGRMTSTAAADGLLPDVLGLVFFGFPLHPPNKPGTSRAAHLYRVEQPMLFLQGTRDDLADLQLLGPIAAELGSRATLHVINGADHSFHGLKKSGKRDEDFLNELADSTARWAETLTS
jgi:uncharacterized protein